MINLVKNEITKIFHKKAIYILAIITLLFTILSAGIIALANNLGDFFSSDAYINSLESSLEYYDLDNSEEASWYVDAKTNVDINKLANEYDKDSWQRSFVFNNVYDYVYRVNEAEFITKDKKDLEEAQIALDAILAEMNEHDWKYFVNKDKDQVEASIKEIEDYLKDGDLSESEKRSYQSMLDSLTYQLDGYNYHLNLNIPVDSSDKSYLIDTYVSSGMQYLQYANKDEDMITNRDELREKRYLEESLYTSKYKLDNDIDSGFMNTASEMVLGEMKSPVLFVVVAIIMIAGGIVAEEFNKGTIKQLLLRPYSRSKILLSKYIASVIVFLLFLLYYLLITSICYGVVFGFSSFTTPVVLYNFTTHEAFQTSFIWNTVVNILSVLPAYLIILTLAFFIGVLTTNTGVSIAVVFLVYLFGGIIESLASLFNAKIIAYIPTMCWNFNQYLYGGMATFQYSTLTKSIIVSVITFIIFFVGSFIVFKRKDIKNQ